MPAHVKTKSGHSLEFIGPPLEEGIKPAIFYFALSAHDSLTLDPFNQPATFLEGEECRIFSMTLPGHGEGMDKLNAMNYWAEHLDELLPFIENCCEAIGELAPGNAAVAGLSRGAFIATHVAARQEDVSHVLGYAPLTDLSRQPDFQEKSIPKELSLFGCADGLINKKLRYYIGNRDLRVGTDACFRLVDQIVDSAYNEGVRSSEVELFISPSIGHKGHGTPPHIFKDGAEWLKRNFMEFYNPTGYNDPLNQSE